jgi:hypothetical protein
LSTGRQQEGRSARRLAVQLHNRKHPVPGGVYILIVALIVLGLVVVWQHNQEPPEEIKQLREDIKKTQQELDQMGK